MKHIHRIDIEWCYDSGLYISCQTVPQEANDRNLNFVLP